MKIESLIKILSGENTFEIYPDGPECGALFRGERKILSIGRIRTGKFDEALGLAEKLRKHFANDRISARADSLNVIPFGCEYQVQRHWNFAGDTGELTVDIAADNGGRISDLSLEDIFFPGRISEVKYLLDGENTMCSSNGKGVIYSGSRLPVMVQVTFADGVKAEFYNGDDFWRYRCAENYPGGSALHTLTLDDSGLRWQRQVLLLPEDAVVEKCPRRFKAMFAADSGSQAPDGEKFTFSGCFASPAGHRDFRNFIRKLAPGTNAVLEVTGQWCCTQGNHVSRPGRTVQHGMLGELFDEYIWGNSIMARKGGSLRINAAVSAMEDSIICRNLQNIPAELIPAETEEA